MEIKSYLLFALVILSAVVVIPATTADNFGYNMYDDPDLKGELVETGVNYTINVNDTNNLQGQPGVYYDQGGNITTLNTLLSNNYTQSADLWTFLSGIDIYGQRVIGAYLGTGKTLENEVPLKEGWNTVGFILNVNTTKRDINVSVTDGKNLLAYSALGSYPVHKIRYTNSTASCYYYQCSGSIKIYYPEDALTTTPFKPSFRLHQGDVFWVEVIDNGNITFEDIRGSDSDIDSNVTWASLLFSNGTGGLLNPTDAGTSNWVISNFRYWDTTYSTWGFISTSNDPPSSEKNYLETWQGALVYSYLDDLTLYINSTSNLIPKNDYGDGYFENVTTPCINYGDGTSQCSAFDSSDVTGNITVSNVTATRVHIQGVDTGNQVDFMIKPAFGKGSGNIMEVYDRLGNLRVYINRYGNLNTYGSFTAEALSTNPNGGSAAAPVVIIGTSNSGFSRISGNGFRWSNNGVEQAHVGNKTGLATTSSDKRLELNIDESGDGIRLSWEDNDGSAENYTDFSQIDSENFVLNSTGNITIQSGLNVGLSGNISVGACWIVFTGGWANGQTNCTKAS